MRKISIIIVITILGLSYSFAQKPLWQGKGRIAISSDGNEHDHDDWAATPLTLALLASQNLQDNMVLYTYSDHIWGSNIDRPTSKSGLSAYEHMHESALGGKKWFGFDNSTFICAVDDPEKAYNALRDEIDKSSKKDPLIIVAAGPMQVVGEAIARADKKKRKYVTLLSHSQWNNRHSDKPSSKEPAHSGWTFMEIEEQFSNKQGGKLKCVQIVDQNGGEGYDGFNAPIEKFDWVKTSEFRNHEAYKDGAWDWLYTRLETCVKSKGKNFDPSDAGMIVYMLTGIEKTEPYMAKELMEQPIVKK